VVQEGVGIGLHTHELAGAGHFKRAQLAYRALGLAFGRAKRGEVVFTDQMRRGGAYSLSPMDVG
jgi:hypothetical protein